MIGSKRLDEIEARERAATPNWIVRDLAMPGEALLQMGDENRHTGLPFRSIQLRLDDALFAAAARADVPDLCAEVRRLVKTLRGWKCTSCNGRGKHHGHGTCLYCNGTGLDERASAALDGYEVDNG